MRKAGLVFAMLVLAAGGAAAQQELAPSTDEGPLAIKPVQPTPGGDGAYRVGPGIEVPVLVRPAPANYPEGSSETDFPHAGMFSAIVGIDGVAKNIQTVSSHTSLYDEPAIAAIERSQFQTGTLNGNPVPVLVYIRVLFSRLRPAIPTLTRHSPQLGNSLRPGAWSGPQLAPQDAPFKLQRGDTPPKVMNAVSAEFTDEARKKKIDGVVIVSVLVNEEGVPIDPQIVRSLEPGLDEKALECALKYVFQPAMHEGVPVAARITIEVNFRLN